MKQVIKIIKVVLELIILVVLISAALIIYATSVEPELLTVVSREITTNSIPLPKEGIKIVQFSDLHLGEDYDHYHFEKVIEKIQSLEPDLIVFTGDLIDNNSTFEGEEETIEAMKKLSAPLGKFSVFGNHDYGGNGDRRYKRIMNASGFKLLVNEHQKVTLSNGAVINVIGMDDLVFGKPRCTPCVEDLREDEYNVFLAHEPDIADEMKRYAIDLQLSGHSHGGQVRVPVFGALLTPKYAKKYIKGMYDIPENPRMKLYVNVGIGTSQLKVRFMSVPEITLFTIKNSQDVSN